MEVFIASAAKGERMTNSEALERLEQMKNLYDGGNFCDALDTAISALRSQQATTEPLTLDGWISTGDDLPPKGSEVWYNIVLTRQRAGQRGDARIVRAGY